jgi:hypothetical protein
MFDSKAKKVASSAIVAAESITEEEAAEYDD